MLGTVLSVILFQALQRAESNRIELAFRRDANDAVASIEVTLSHGLDAVTALDSLYSAVPEVSRAAFRAFTAEHLLEEPGVVFLGWAPLIGRSNRREFEAGVRAEAGDDPKLVPFLERFQIFEEELESSVPASQRSEYFPVLHAEPPRAWHTLGFDISSDPVQIEALEHARSSGQMGVTGRAIINPSTPDDVGVIVFHPVTRGPSSVDPAEYQAKELAGFAMVMLEVGAVVERALAGLEPRGIDIVVHDRSADSAESLLYYRESTLVPRGSTPWTLQEALESTDLTLTKTVQVGDREWVISCRRALGYVASQQTLTPLIALVGGLLLSCSFAGLFLMALRREAEAREHTRELSVAKEELEREAEEREEVRVELAASEERFRAAFGNAPVGMLIVDLELRVVQANPLLCRTLRYTEAELLELSTGDVVHPEDKAKEEALLARLLSGDAESVQDTLRLRRRDGEVAWVELHGSLVRDESDRPLYFLGHLQDIGERRRTAEKLRQARETQERILDSLPLNVFLKDSGGRIRFMNAACLRLLGRQKDEVVGLTDFDLFPEHVAAELRRIDELALSEGKAVPTEERLEVGGRVFHLLAGKTVIKVAGSDEPHLLGFSIDITANREVQEAFAESEFRFRQLVENMSSGVSVYEAVEDGRDFVLRDYNSAAERMDGVSRDEVIGKRLTAVFPGAEEMGLLALLQSVHWTGEPKRLPSTLYSDQRLAGWRETYAYRLPSGELVAVYDDVSERKRLEAELLHAQKMEAIGRLAGGVAHDFNNLLQVVAGNCDLLLDDRDDSADRDEMLEEIREQAERGTQLVRRLLAFSRREAGAAQAADLGEIVRGAETLVRRLLKENIRLEIELSDVPLPIVGDSGQLEQVLMNLVVNAADAMPQGGALRIRSGDDGNAEVWFSVADSGPGIEEELVGKVFEPYFTTKSAAQGTGLGLAVVDGIVSLHQGRVEVDNRPGAGVEFKVFLPRSEERTEGSRAEPKVAASAPGNGESVLVVEDQDLVRKTIRTMLSSLGYQVTTAGSGDEARRLAVGTPFDLLVSDIVLPDLTGVDLANELRGNRPELAVLLVSGYAEESVRERATGLRFLQKPFRRDDLARQVAAALQDKAAASR